MQGISAVDNYGHWMLDILPKLTSAKVLLGSSFNLLIPKSSFPKAKKLNSKWYYDDNGYNEELNLMRDFVKIRINQLDKYFNSL